VKAELKDGCLSVNLAELLDYMTPDEKRDLAESLSLQDSIIENVASQIITGWTEASSHAANDSNAADPHYPLGKAIRQVAMKASEVAAEQIESLARSLRWQKAYADATHEWAFEMYHMMHTAGLKPPNLPGVNETNPHEYIVIKKSDGNPL
jgi:hypothetical protein